jgi:hypothetical protein
MTSSVRTPAPAGYILFLDTSDFQEGGHSPGDAVPCKHAFGCITVSRIQYGNLQINEDYICVILCWLAFQILVHQAKLACRRSWLGAVCVFLFYSWDMRKRELGTAHTGPGKRLTKLSNRHCRRFHTGKRRQVHVQALHFCIEHTTSCLSWFQVIFELTAINSS